VTLKKGKHIRKQHKPIQS